MAVTVPKIVKGSGTTVTLNGLDKDIVFEFNEKFEFKTF